MKPNASLKAGADPAQERKFHKATSQKIADEYVEKLKKRVGLPRSDLKVTLDGVEEPKGVADIPQQKDGRRYSFRRNLCTSGPAVSIKA